ncbi:MAG TPA: heavy metal-associated domain-containing protein, partial [Roseiflexaceae bacterium]|nr:heavy metal-associated domain-containing protein [Roseiflexaceae bacterium]
MAIDQFRVPEMSCQHCVNAITKEVSALSGVTDVKVNLADKSVRVVHTDNVTTSDLVKAIN